MTESYDVRGKVSALSGDIEEVCKIREMIEEQYRELVRLAEKEDIEPENLMVFPATRPPSFPDEGDGQRWIYGVILTDYDFDAERYLVLSTKDSSEVYSDHSGEEEELMVASTDEWMYHPERFSHNLHALYML